jgi:transposase
MTRRRKHSAEFKREAVKLAKRGEVSHTQVAQELGIHPNLLRNWVRKFDTGNWEPVASGQLKSAQTQELEKVRRELNRVKTERDILKKALAYFAKEPS